jgi:hypothetical protein
MNLYREGPQELKGPLDSPGRPGHDHTLGEPWRAGGQTHLRVSNWSRAEGHRLILDDIAEIYAEPGIHLVVDTGPHGLMRPYPEAFEQLRRDGIEVEACRRRTRFAVTASSIPDARRRST